MGWSHTACRRRLGGRPLPAALRGPGCSGLRCGPRLTSGWRHAGTDGRWAPAPSCAGREATPAARRWLTEARQASPTPGLRRAGLRRSAPPPPGRPPQPPIPIRSARVRGYSRPFTSDPAPGSRAVWAPGGGGEARARARVSQWARGAGRGDVRRCRWSERLSAIRGRAVRGRAGLGRGGCPFCLGGFGTSPTAPPPGRERSRSHGSTRNSPQGPAGE